MESVAAAAPPTAYSELRSSLLVTIPCLLPLLSPRFCRCVATGDSGAMALVACLDRFVGQGEEGGPLSEASAGRRATGVRGVRARVPRNGLCHSCACERVAGQGLLPGVGSAAEVCRRAAAAARQEGSVFF